MKRTVEQSEIDRILSREDEILPSSGFCASVMEAVRREAAVPPPIPFPWKRALPVLILFVAALVATLVGCVVAFARPVSTSSVPLPDFFSFLKHPSGLQSAVNWTLLALFGALVSVKVSMRLVSGR